MLTDNECVELKRLLFKLKAELTIEEKDERKDIDNVIDLVVIYEEILFMKQEK